MFSKNSRYKELPDIFLSKDDFTSKSKTFRCIPKTEGAIRHQVSEADRLDLMAFNYYKDPEKWWKICDANPEYMMPMDLLNNNPVITEDFQLENNPDRLSVLPKLIKKLEESKGVIKTKVNRFEPDPIIETATITKIQIQYNENETNQSVIKGIIESENIKIKRINRITSAGRRIWIPAK